MRKIIEDAEMRLRRIGTLVDEDSLRWNLYAVIQDVFDVLAIMFSELGWRKPPLYSRMAEEAVERGLLPEGFPVYAKIRNALAHAYREIGGRELEDIRRKVLEEMPTAIDILRKFVASMGVGPVVSWSEAAPIFRRHGVKFAYLFGSRARGDAREDSDWDIAVYFGRRATVLDEAELAAELSRALGVEVDVVALDSAILDLIYTVLRDGVVIYSDDEEVRRRWEIASYLEYLDFADDYLGW